VSAVRNKAVVVVHEDKLPRILMGVNDRLDTSATLLEIYDSGVG